MAKIAVAVDVDERKLSLATGPGQHPEQDRAVAANDDR
jgi:hypothetical protein